MFKNYAKTLTTTTYSQLEKLSSLDCVKNLILFPSLRTEEALPTGLAVVTNKAVVPSWLDNLGEGVTSMNLGLSSKHFTPVVLRAIHKQLESIPAYAKPNKSAVIDPVLERIDHTPDMHKFMTSTGRYLLGILGNSGNFIELAVDNSNEVWLLVKADCKIFSQAYYNRYEAILGKVGGTNFPQGSYNCAAAVTDAGFVQAFSTANRLKILQKAVSVIEEQTSMTVKASGIISHNFNTLLRDDKNADQYVVRRGCARVYKDSLVVVLGNQAEGSYLVKAKDTSVSAYSIGVVSGRKVARSQLGGSITLTSLYESLQGKVGYIVNALCHFGPEAYKPLAQTLNNQSDLLEKISPLASLMTFKSLE